MKFSGATLERQGAAPRTGCRLLNAGANIFPGHKPQLGRTVHHTDVLNRVEHRWCQTAHRRVQVGGVGQLILHELGDVPGEAVPYAGFS